MDRLSPETLECLLQTYRVAISELRGAADPATNRLIDELAQLQAEAVAALAEVRTRAA